jgi:copper chaperone
MLVFRVDDMSCSHCVATITGAVKQADPAAEVSTDLARHLVQVNSASAAGAIEKAIRDAGYSPQVVS